MCLVSVSGSRFGSGSTFRLVSTGVRHALINWTLDQAMGRAGIGPASGLLSPLHTTVAAITDSEMVRHVYCAILTVHIDIFQKACFWLQCLVELATSDRVVRRHVGRIDLAVSITVTPGRS